MEDRRAQQVVDWAESSMNDENWFRWSITNSEGRSANVQFRVDPSIAAIAERIVEYHPWLEWGGKKAQGKEAASYDTVALVKHINAAIKILAGK